MKDISFQDFKGMDDDNKWQYVWQILSNHLHQIMEIKWWVRGVGVAMAIYLGKMLITG